KIYFYDNGVAGYLWGIEKEELLETHPLRGVEFENMVILKFVKQRVNAGKVPHLYYYRDNSQREVDLIEERGTALYAYEIKSSKAFTKNFVQNLDYFRQVAGQDVVSTQVIYDGEINIETPENGMLNF